MLDQAARHRVYSHLLNAREHPDDDRRHVRPPTWETFGGRTRFTTLRGFRTEHDASGGSLEEYLSSLKDRDFRVEIVNYVEDIERHTRTFDLGDVITPFYPILFATNLAEVLDEIKQRGLYLSDIWGYVPGSGPGGYWQQYKPPQGVLELIDSKLGERWLGMDVGEQDGRYISSYAPLLHPPGAERLEQYLNFQRHFERMCGELGNRMSTLVSLNFGHYLLKEGVYTLIGAETAQALPNGQVYYAFIRGAGKQYGVPWFGNASCFNRWGYKAYGTEGPDYSPSKGTSLSLLKRLLYSHVLYNCMLVGFEMGWLDGGVLSPIGRIQQAANQWVKKNDQPGVMQTPVALMLDFFCGWSFPRNANTDKLYRVWGNLPYGAGDHLTDGVLDMLYPGYQDSSYFHDESGFIAPTPYGDAADCLLSDAPGWLLARYPLLVIGGELGGGAEIRDKLTEYAANGGRLIITAGNIASLPGGLAGIQVAESLQRLEPGTAVQVADERVVETSAFDLMPLSVPRDARTLVRCGERPVVVEVACGRGSIVVFANPFGICAEPATAERPSSEIDRPLPNPYPLLKHVRAILDAEFRSQMLFEVGDGLSLITCRKDRGEYTIGICNNALRMQPFSIRSYCGEIESISELPLDKCEKAAVGYLPEGFESAQTGKSDENTIAGGDVRIFAVRVHEEGVLEIPHITAPPRPRGRSLSLGRPRSIKEAALGRPTLFEHFDGVMVDWRYLHERTRDALSSEAGWIKRQGLRVTVDLTSGVNLYPDLRFVDNIREEHAASMATIRDILAKMQILGARDLILSLHPVPPSNYTREQTWRSFRRTLARLCRRAAPLGITLYLRPRHREWSATHHSMWACATGPEDTVPLIECVGMDNLRLAVSAAQLLANRIEPQQAKKLLGDKAGLWLVSAPEFDIAGKAWNVNAPVAGSSDLGRIAELLAIFPDAPLVFDAVYRNQDEEYLDARALERIMAGAQQAVAE